MMFIFFPTPSLVCSGHRQLDKPQGLTRMQGKRR
jgi:hypothetical protein